MRVADLMTTELITLNEADNLDLARMEMDLARIRHLPVVRRGRLVGLVTHRDILRAMCSVFAELDGMEQANLLREVPVLEIMSRGVQTVEPDLDAAEAGQLLLENKFGCLPVVADGDRLVGIVTEADFVELALHYLEQRRAQQAVEVTDEEPAEPDAAYQFPEVENEHEDEHEHEHEDEDEGW